MDLGLSVYLLVCLGVLLVVGPAKERLMRTGLGCLLGFLLGALAATIAFKYGFDPDKTYQEKVIEERIARTPVQYIEIKGKKGRVTVHTGMPKDSVELLVGKPDEVDMDTYGSYVVERWGYKIVDKYYPDLRIEFKNGTLTNLDQN